jgi:broad specificity phosphatase PhoE
MHAPKTIYLFRHGEVADRYKKRFRGTLDAELSESGKAMSVKNAEFIVNEKVELVVTTGLQRSNEVGTLVRPRGIPHEIHKGFREAEFGLWEGKSWEEVNRDFPSEVQLYQTDPLKLQFPGGEAVAAVRDRVLAAFHEMLARPEAKIAVIGHSTTNTLLLAHLKNMGFRQLGLQVIGSFHEIQSTPSGLVIARENVVVY